MATLADVARVAGVTAATVSNVLTGRVGVREETRVRVLAAVAMVRYRPNLVARGLARGNTSTIALLVPSLTNPFFAEVVEAMETIADAHDYQILLALAHGRTAQGARHLERLVSRWVDGFIIMGGAAPTDDVLALAQTGMSVVLSIWGDDAALNLPLVEIDFAQAGKLATQHLLDIGHRRIAVIVELPVQQTRLTGYQETLQRAEISVPFDYLRLGDSSFASGRCEMHALLALPQPPTALFAGNDAMAMGAIEALHEAGLRIPQDIAVVGVDDVQGAEYTHPPLTTIHIPTRDLARIVMDLSLRGIAGERTSIHQMLVPTLVLRHST